MKKSTFALALSFVMAVFLFVSHTTHAAEQVGVDQLPFQDAYKAVVLVKTVGLDGEGALAIASQGSGVIIDQSGLVLTNHHVVTLELEYDGSVDESGYQICIPDTVSTEPPCTYTADLVYSNKELDIALLQIRAIPGLSDMQSFPALQLAATDTTDINDDVTALGYPAIGEDTITITKGIVSGKVDKYNESWIKTDAVVTFGNSGGAAIDSEGKLIGIPTQAHADVAGSLGYIINAASIYDVVQNNKSNSPQRVSFDTRLTTFTRVLHELNTTNQYTSFHPPFTITKPSQWEFFVSRESVVQLDNPADDEGGIVTISTYKFPLPITTTHGITYLRHAMDESGILAFVTIEPGENVVINGHAGKKIIFSAFGEQSVKYVFAHREYMIFVEYDYGVNDKDRALVESVINSLELNSFSEQFQATNQYTHDGPVFSLQSGAGWYIQPIGLGNKPLRIMSEIFPGVYGEVTLTKADETNENYNNDQVLERIKKTVAEVNQLGQSSDMVMEIVSSDPHYSLNSSVDDVVHVHSITKRISTGEVLLEVDEYNMRVGNEYINIGFYIPRGEQVTSFTEAQASFRRLVQSFRLSNNPGSVPSQSQNTQQQTNPTRVDLTSDSSEVRNVLARERQRMRQVNPQLGERLRGYILLQVEEAGEAWYLDHESKRRYYLSDRETAFTALREFGLGISNADLAKIPVGIEDRFTEDDQDGDGLPDKLEEGLGTRVDNADSDGDGYDDGTEVRNGYNPRGAGTMTIDQSLANRLRGRIVLQVQDRGQAWYINPQDGKRYYMKDGEAAYQILRYLSLGISNDDLATIEVGDL